MKWSEESKMAVEWDECLLEPSSSSGHETEIV